MRTFEVRWQRFRGFEDTDWLEIRPITVVIGANASGKTSLLGPLLMLKQTLEASDPSIGLKTKGELFNAGVFDDLIHCHHKRERLSFSLRLGRRPSDGKNIKPIGAYPPGEFEFTFDRNDENPSSPLLASYDVRDVFGRRLVLRKRLPSGRYSTRTLKLQSMRRGFRTAIRNTPPEGFLFTVDPLMRWLFRALEGKSKKSTGKKVTRTVRIPEAESLYLGTLAYTGSEMERILSKIAFIGPLREYPRRLYEVRGDKPANVGTRGEFTPEVLYRNRNGKLATSVNDWIRKFDFGFRLECQEVAKGAFAINLKRTKTSPAINLADTGFGLSQILPLIVQCYVGDSDGVIIAEQPEIHLNPRLQSLLADLFCEVVGQDKRTVLVETHSEYIVLRLRRLIAEGKLKPDDVALYYTERSGDDLLVRRISIDRNGHIPTDAWPRGFFEDSMHEAFALAMTQDRRGSNA